MIIEASYQDEDVVFELMNELEAGSLECEAFALQYRSCIIVMLQEKLVN